MSIIQTAIVTFVVQNGTGTQSITHQVIDDRTGVEFVGKFAVIQSAYAVINTLTSAPGGAYPYYADYRGVELNSGSVVRSAHTSADAFSIFGFKSVASGESRGDHSILDVWADNFGTAQIYREAKISSWYLGGFDVQLDLNNRAGDTVTMIVFGGDGLDVTAINVTNGTYTLPSKPQGLLAIPTIFPNASGSTTGATGGHNIAWGFDTPDGNRGTSNLHVVAQGQNWSAQLEDAYSCDIDFTTGVLNASRPIVSAWNALSVVISGNTFGIGSIPFIFSGANIRCSGGFFDQNTTPGSYTFDTNIDAYAILLFAIGQIASTSVYSGAGQLVRGWGTKNVQGGFWSGEATVGNVGPSKGARYLANNTLLRFGTPNGASTTFPNIATLLELSPLGTATINWSAVDGTARRIGWFAIGLERQTNPANIGQGIYKMIPERLNDQVYLDFSNGDSALFKIPDPKIFTSLVGDE